MLLAGFAFGYAIGIGVGILRVDADAAPLALTPVAHAQAAPAR
jgi:hypothetical protein